MGNKTVKLNVGGVSYEVSHSLLEADTDTMLARLVSERWQKKSDEAIFIDRNGNRFQYVLDYMRDKEVHLPISIPKASFLKDLDYYGFVNVNANSIHGGRTVAQVAARLTECEQQYNATMTEYDNRVKAIEKQKWFDMIAFSCFKQYCKDGRLSDMRGYADSPFHVLVSSQLQKGQGPVWLDPNLLRSSNHAKDLELWNECFAKYGLKVAKISGWNFDLSLLEDTSGNDVAANL